jgi:hypothetical protein
VVFLEDMRDPLLLQGTGHDGQQFYAIAREPMHLRDAAKYLDSARYREQRVGFPVLAWLVHPTGGGRGLVWALLGVNALGVVVAGLAVGLVTTSYRGPPAVAATAAIVPGAFASLWVGTPDVLAFGLALLAVALAVRGHARVALPVAVLAVLTRETAILVLLAYVVGRRRWRQDAALLVGPGALLLAWYLVLHELVPDGPVSPPVGLPFAGIASSMRWGFSSGQNWQIPAGAASLLLGLVLGLLALAYSRITWLRWAVALQLLLIVFLDGIALGPFFNAARIAAPVTLLSVVALASRRDVPRALATGLQPVVADA